MIQDVISGQARTCERDHANFAVDGAKGAGD